MCQQREVSANPPTTGDFMWCQLVPDGAFPTCEKFSSEPAQNQPTQNHATSYSVSEKTTSVVVKQGLVKAKAGSAGSC